MALLELYQEAGFEMDTEVVAAWELLRSMLLREHLGAWIGRFTAAVKSGAGTDFYRQLADLTERFVQMETASTQPASH